MKTIIELFDECQIENVIAGLRFLPEKIVFVGFKEVMTKKRMNDLKRFFDVRKINISLEFEFVGRYDYQFIVDKLCKIIENNEDCVFDLTGGKELVLTAMGEVSKTFDVPMLQFNVRSGNLIRVKNCDNIEETKKSSMLISESVVLNGGETVLSEKFVPWDITSDFKKDVFTMWNICKRNCALWNFHCNLFKNLEKTGYTNENFVSVNLSDLKVLPDSRIMIPLAKAKLISGYNPESDVLSFTYKNEQIRRCLTKAGDILELYTYITAKEISHENSGYYDDIDIGVVVDWDGVIHPEGDAVAETRNEIDVMLMRDLVPIFISCKNGEVHKEALYELNTVARKFGGEYSKKILLTTYISSVAESRKYIMQRARDMNIDIIEGIDKMDYKEFAETLRKRVK